MSLMTERDKWMFSKYYGRQDLAGDDVFWSDIFNIYKDNNVPLPMPVKPESIRQFFDGFTCARCGDCCRYPHTNILEREITLINKSSDENARLLAGALEDFEDKKCIKAICPFLTDNNCSIYSIRPNTCYFYPLQLYTGPEIDVRGKKERVLFCRVKCVSSVRAIRAVIAQMLNRNGKYVLLPNLNIIKMEVN